MCLMSHQTLMSWCFTARYLFNAYIHLARPLCNYFLALQSPSVDNHQAGEEHLDAAAALPDQQADVRFTAQQIRALAISGQLTLPGFTPVSCPYVQLGPR